MDNRDEKDERIEELSIAVWRLLQFFNEQGLHVSRVDLPAGTQQCAVAASRAAIAGFLGPSDRVDPLVEALEATGDDEAKERAWRLRAQLAERGFEVVSTRPPADQLHPA